MKKLLIISFVALFSCESKSPEAPVTDPLPKETEKPLVEVKAPGATKAAKAVEKIDNDIAFFTKRLESDKGTFLDAQTVVGRWMSRFRLTGNIDDLVQSQRVLKLAQKKFSDPAPLAITVASFHNSIHEIDESTKYAEKALSISRTTDDKSAAIGLLADNAFLRGDLKTAKEKYTEAYELDNSVGGAIRLSSFHQKVGKWDEAKKWGDTALEKAKTGDDWSQAFALLSRGALELEQCRYDEALKYFEKADKAYGGWFLVEEHIAEILAAQGKNDDARKKYEHVLSRVPNGQFYHALSDVEAESENKARADELAKAAIEASERDIKKMPTAMGGHALDVYLEFGPADRAVTLAEQDHTLRPGFESKTKLALAYINAGTTEKAEPLMKAVEASEWNTVDSNLVIAYLATKAGDEKKAKTYSERADAICPGSSEDLKSFP